MKEFPYGFFYGKHSLCFLTFPEKNLKLDLCLFLSSTFSSNTYRFFH